MPIFRNLATIFLVLPAATACVNAEKPVPRKPVPIPAPARTPQLPAPRPVVAVPARTDVPPDAMVQGVKALWAAFPDRAGIAVMPVDGSWTIEHRGGEPMPQQSVSKLWVAITLMQAVDDGTLRLVDSVTIRAEDVTVFSRAAAAKVGPTGWATTLGDLLELSLTKSDNTANDVLLRKVGGPTAVRAMISAKGLGAIRFGPGEHLLQSGTAGLVWSEAYRPGQAFQVARAKLSEEARRAAMDAYVTNPPDGAAPVAVARALARLKRGELLSAASTRRILALMQEAQTGPSRVKGGVPYDWSYAHKTGTGQDFRGRTAGYNDVGILTAPDGTSYTLAVMIADTSRPIAERQALMQGISATIAANHRR